MSPVQLRTVLRRLRRAAGQQDAGRSDAHLLERFAGGDEAAFELLLWRHGPMVLCTCRRVLRREQDAEDAFQVTFLTLARKAGAIGKREAVAGWLYKVAYRAALQVRAAAQRQPRAAHSDVEPAAPEETPSAEARELRPVLDEEVGRLPEKYRAPVVLCYLEGKTYAEAARLLGCPTGTVAIRLRRARERLRVRLTRRGLAAPTALVAAALVPAAAPAAVPAALFRAALEAVAGPAPAHLGALTEGVVRAMFVSKLKAMTAAVVVALAALGTGAGALLSQGPAKRAGRAGPAPAAAKDRDPRGQEVPSEVSGVLLFVGTDVKEGEKVPAALLLKVKVDGKERTYRRLRVGDRVEEGQLVARVDDRPARAEVAIAQARLEVAKADHRASEATRDEAQKRYERLVNTKKRVAGAVSEEEVRAAKLTWDRYKEEERAKAAGVDVAKAQLEVARAILERHAIRSSVRGVIRAIYKRRGEAVKALESVLRIESDERPPPAVGAGREHIDVPAERDGKLLFLGTEVKPGEKMPPDKLIKVERDFLLLEINAEEYAQTPAAERLTFEGNKRKYRRWKKGDELRPDKIVLGRKEATYRKLAAGDHTEAGQLLGLVNPALALGELSVKIAKLEAADADRMASAASKEEAGKRVDYMRKTRKKAPGAISDDEYRAAMLTWERYKQEEVAKTAAVWLAQRELAQALTTLDMHEIRSPVAGEVRHIYRRRGEAVKNLEPVLQIEETPRD